MSFLETPQDGDVANLPQTTNTLHRVA